MIHILMPVACSLVFFVAGYLIGLKGMAITMIKKIIVVQRDRGMGEQAILDFINSIKNSDEKDAEL